MEVKIKKPFSYVQSLAEDVCQGDVEAAILALLMDMGFQSHTDGFGYLRMALLIRYQNPGMRVSMIYMQIVQTSEIALTTKVVEQGILSSIETAWNNRDEEQWNLFFNEKKMGRAGRPTNREFISEIACFMELWSSYCKGVCRGGTK